MMHKLRFLHIPKSAGSTLISILRRQYGAHGIFTFEGGRKSYNKRYQSLSSEEKRGILLFTGHAPIVTGIRDADDATIFTLLREPVSRVKSYCLHVAEGKTPHLVGKYPPREFDLDRFLDSGSNELSNLQTKMLINRGRLASPREIEKMSVFEACDKALDNLFNKISIFGLQEYFDESLMMFSRDLGWDIPLYEVLNRSMAGVPVAFSQYHVDRKAELNSLDTQVYSVARERFLEKLQGDEVLDEMLEAFRRRNAPVNRSDGV